MNRIHSRGTSAKLNILAGLLQELVAVICGLILPRVILSAFGSTYNGIINSVTQFLGFSAVLRSGLGAVTNAALYKPLADGDWDKVSGIMVATDKFMRKVGWLLAALIAGFALLYPLAVLDEFPYWFSGPLVLFIGISTFVENMFSIKYKILLQADQKYYIQTIFAVVAQILATVISIVLIYLNCGIHLVKLGAAMGMMSTPFLLKLYVDRNYRINWKAMADNVAIKSRWDAFAQQLATIVNNNVPTIIMTLLLPLNEVSVYSVYYMVTHNVNKLLASCLSGLKSTFGNMLARGETAHLRKRFYDVEYLVFLGSTIIFTVTAIMLTPFVLVYTKGITDADYNRLALGYGLAIVNMLNVLRIPYQLIVEAAGHFKQTRNGAFLEVALNVTISLVMAKWIGILGVVVGGFVATLVRNIQFVWYANCRLMGIELWRALKNYAGYLAAGCLLTWAVPKVIPISCESYLTWALSAVAVFAIVAVALVVVSAVLSPKQFRSFLKNTFKRRKKHET